MNRRRTSRERGSALVELSLCLMTFLLLTLGAMDYGWGVYAYNFCSFAAQDASRWASVHGSQSASPATVEDVKSYVLGQAVGLPSSQFTITPCWSGVCPTSGAPPAGDNAPGTTVTVTVKYTIQPLSGLAIKQNLTVGSTGQFVINH